MQSKISEFSYGFALINELVGWVNLQAAPIFPSLLEEGKEGGGYDVKLDAPGIPLLIQFKRSECMTRRSAKEFKAVEAVGGELEVPYYRFPITEGSISDQHEMLLQHDDGSNLVFYAAPRFHEPDEINAAWHAKEITQRSIFVSPRTIGVLSDEPHKIAFDETNTWRCSDPKKVGFLNSLDLNKKLIETLQAENYDLRSRLPSLVTGLQQSQRRGLEVAKEQRRLGEERRRKEREALAADTDQPEIQVQYRSYVAPRGSDESGQRRTPAALPEPVEMREPKPLDESTKVLREAADLAARVFDAQLMIIQEPN